MNTVYVLIMLWGGTWGDSGIAVVQQEFDSLQRCEYAMQELAKAHKSAGSGGSAGNMKLKAQGCFKK
jgi:hypothetical protein